MVMMVVMMVVIVVMGVVMVVVIGVVVVMMMMVVVMMDLTAILIRLILPMQKIKIAKCVAMKLEEVSDK